MTQWYDPIGERWHKMPEPPLPVRQPEPVVDVYEAAYRKVYVDNVWQAVVSTANATHVAPKDEAPNDD